MGPRISKQDATRSLREAKAWKKFVRPALWGRFVPASGPPRTWRGTLSALAAALAWGLVRVSPLPQQPVALLVAGVMWALRVKVKKVAA